RGRGKMITPWTVRSATPGRLRLQHHLVKDREPFVEDLKAALRGLHSEIEFSINRLSASTLVQYNPDTVCQDSLMRTLNDLLESSLNKLGAINLEEDIDPEDRLPALQIVLSTTAMLTGAAAIPLSVLHLPALALTVGAAGHIIVRGLKALWVEHRAKVDLLDTTVILSAIYFRQVAAAAFMVWIVDLSDLLLRFSTRDARKKLHEIFGYQVRRAWRVVGDTEVECEVADLAVGDVVIVRSGDQIPVDGMILGGEALIDQSALTGEAIP